MKKAIFLTMTLLATQGAIAESGTESFKYLVIDNDEQLAGTVTSDSKTLKYEEYLESCLSFAKDEEYEAAEEACSSAISLSRNLKWPNKSLAKAYAYNNRGVVRQLASKNVGALDDFKRAVKISEMEVIRYNLEKITDRINNT